MLAPMREFRGDINEAVCRRDDVDPTWWLEPDYEVEVSDDLEGTLKAQATAVATAGALIESRENQMRAKILCYQCPLLEACRAYGWMEGYHVWGGLDASERFKVLKTRTTASLPKPAKGRFLEWDGWIMDFLRGDSVEKVAANHGKAIATVTNRIRGTLAALREERRDYEWSSRNYLPKLPGKMDRATYRHGRALSRTSDADSA